MKKDSYGDELFVIYKKRWKKNIAADEKDYNLSDENLRLKIKKHLKKVMLFCLDDCL